MTSIPEAPLGTSPQSEPLSKSWNRREEEWAQPLKEWHGHCRCSVAQSRPTLYNPMDCTHARLPCPSLSPGVCSNSCPLSQWCHPTISSSVIPFSGCPQSLPASVSFTVSQLFESGGQSIGVLASASVLPMNIQGWFPLGWTGLISLLSKGLSKVFSSTIVW